ncbi:general stress protein [Mesobacillus harenae]|uniref:general stress protein n=1 Tax=Mesobacillus harenae TaxID=2213203 RepID=UPI00157FDF9F|nr:general stress protein [Mesobacillus harenae]
MEKRIIGGVFENEENAIRAIEDLRKMGYDKDSISVFAKSHDDVENLEDATGSDVETGNDAERGKAAGKGAAIGAGSGGILGGIVGLIAEVGLLAIPGIGPLAAAGPLATTLSGAAIGAGGGGIVGALTGAGIPEDDAKEYERYIKEGNILLLVEADDTKERDVYQTFTTNRTLNTNMYPTH